MVKFLRASLVAAVLVASAVAEQDVKVVIAEPTDHACYRRTHQAKNKKCAQGFEFDKALTCWAECPLEYPVECGMECIPQNKDCTKEILGKVTSVAAAALKTASLSVAQLGVASKGVDIGIRCGQQLFGVMEKALAYTQELEAKFPDTTKDQLMSLAMHADVAAVDMPLAVTTCFNLPVPANMGQIGNEVSVAVKTAVQTLFGMTSSSFTPSLTPESFANVTNSMFTGTTAANVLPKSGNEIQAVLDSGTTCGKNVKSAIDELMALAKQVKSENADATAAIIRIALNASPVVLKVIPAAIQTCGSSVQDIRKLIDTVISEVTSAAEKNGKPVDKGTYALALADMALDAISTLDPTGIAAMVKEFVEPICDPTILLGEVDDGAASTSLGLRTMGKAFVGSSGTWKNAGDGMVSITFQSSDNKDVKVNIKSGGNVIDQVKVKAGKSATWTRPLADMQDKTLYMDRWRPGFLGLPGTGGGSLLLWVPHSSQGGHLDMTVQLQVS